MFAQEQEAMIVVREYEEKRDKLAVEDLEKRSEVVQKGKPSIVTDLLGDPIGRIRNLPLHVMLVAECVNEKKMVGVIRGLIKTVTRGKKSGASSDGFSVYVKVGYILGLRVSPTSRRLGIATRLVQELEEWCRRNGADYAYMATDSSNQASINLFTRKFNYVKFRTPRVLVQPVHVHYKQIGSGVAIVQIPPQLAEKFYRKIFVNSEFFPADIDLVLKNKLSLGTFMALPKKALPSWDPRTGKLPPPSFAVLSIWNTKEVYKLQVKGVSPVNKYGFCLGRRVLDALLPWLRVASIANNVFNSFGFYLLYGLHMVGNGGSCLMKSLCAFAHNMARDDSGCELLVAEVGPRDPISEAIPHWRKYSWDEDVWCIKKLVTAADHEEAKEGAYEWIQSSGISSPPVIFVDPRDF